MARKTASTRWLIVSLCVLLVGFVIEYYAHALGAFILIECPDMSAHAPGHCAHPYWLAIIGAFLMALGAAGTLGTALWKGWRRLRTDER